MSEAPKPADGTEPQAPAPGDAEAAASNEAPLPSDPAAAAEVPPAEPAAAASAEQPAGAVVGRPDLEAATTHDGGPIASAGHGQVPARTAPRRRTKAEPELEIVTWVSKKSKGPRRLLRNRLFVFFVIIPTLISAIYYGMIASDVFISESRFVVRTPQRSSQPSLMGELLKGSSFMRAQDDAFTVRDFVESRDALRELQQKLEIKQAYSSEEIDPINRFPGLFDDDSFESFYKYYEKHLKVDFDAASAITTLQVRAFDPEMARKINARLLELSEKLVNQINERGRLDLVQYALAEVRDAEVKAKAAALAVASYRNKREVFDPERQSALQLQQISKLQDELIATKLQLAQVQSLSPQNPQIEALQKRVAGLTANMSAEMAKVAGGSGDSFSNKAADFERLQLERTFAERQVASALTSLESARNEARRQQLYLERIVQPNLPDEALEPRRLRNVLATLLLGLIGWGIASMLLSGVKEHQA